MAGVWVVCHEDVALSNIFILSTSAAGLHYIMPFLVVH
jgi:hypothetical protein